MNTFKKFDIVHYNDEEYVINTKLSNIDYEVINRQTGQKEKAYIKDIILIESYVEPKQNIESELNNYIPNTKLSNPKDNFAVNKVPYSVLPISVLNEVAVGMYEGSLKYGSHNYREAGVDARVYFNATLRHLFSWFEGEDIDPDSDIHHISKAITSLMVLKDGIDQNKFNDTRPIKSQIKCSDFELKIKKLNNKYTEPIKPYLEKNND